MVEIMSPIAFEDSSWEKVSHFEVQKNPQKFGPNYGVGRKVTAGKTLYSAKLPASSSATGKTIKLGLFATSEEATAAVQYALQHPGFYFQDVQDMVPVVREAEILEPSFCERNVPMKREFREKQASKENALSKKSVQRESQVHIGEEFKKALAVGFESELKNIKSWSRFSRALETVVLNLMQTFFPSRKGDVVNENLKSGAFDFSRDALIALWHHEHDGQTQDEWSVTCVEDFVRLTKEERYSQQYGSWVDEHVFE